MEGIKTKELCETPVSKYVKNRMLLNQIRRNVSGFFAPLKFLTNNTKKRTIQMITIII
jgi:hypothetical protein